MFRGTCIVATFFIVSLCARNCTPSIKLLAISETAKLELFRLFGANKGSFGGVSRYLHRCQLFTASLCARNSIPGIKLWAISETAKLEFF